MQLLGFFKYGKSSGQSYKKTRKRTGKMAKEKLR